MPVRNLVEGEMPTRKGSPQGAPDWVPGYFPDVRTLDYIVKFATAALVTLGVLYMIGIRPKPVRAAVAMRDAVL